MINFFLDPLLRLAGYSADRLPKNEEKIRGEILLDHDRAFGAKEKVTATASQAAMLEKIGSDRNASPYTSYPFKYTVVFRAPYFNKRW